MSLPDILNAIANLGFPIFVAVFLLLQNRATTKVIEANTQALQRFCDQTIKS